MRKTFIFTIIFSLIFGSFIGYCSDKNYDLKDIYFGFVNNQRTSIVATEYGGYDIKAPQKLSIAIFPNGEVHKLNFLEYREQSPQSNGRQNCHNFDYCGGYYYKLINGATKDGGSCMLVATGFMKEWKILSFQLDKNIKSDRSSINQIEKFKKMKVHDIQLLAKFDESNYLYFVIYNTNEDQLLADLVLRMGNMFYEDSSGTSENYNDEDQDFFTGLGISNYCDVLNIFRNGKDYLFMLEWYTEEGTHLGLMMIQENKLVLIQHSARYTYPI